MAKMVGWFFGLKYQKTGLPTRTLYRLVRVIDGGLQARTAAVGQPKEW
jgi:hypothetical protein